MYVEIPVDTRLVCIRLRAGIYIKVCMRTGTVYIRLQHNYKTYAYRSPYIPKTCVNSILQQPIIKYQVVSLTNILMYY